MAFDTDMIGPMGFCCDISRTFHTGPGTATDGQRRMYGLAVEQIQHNLGLLKAGVGFREISEKSFGLPEPYYPNRYANVMHGVGLTDEWPVIVNRSDWDTRGYEGALEESMILSVESYVGATGGTDGVKRTARSSRAMDISSCPPSPTRNGWEVEYTQFYAGSFQNFALVMRRATASAAA